MTTIGDILAVVAALFGIGATTWAFVLAISFLGPEATARARARVEGGAWECGVLGVLYGLIPLVGIGIVNIPFPIAKLVGALLVGVSLAVAALGVAGVASLLGDRIRFASGLTPFAATGRAAALLAAMVQIPFFGWFLVLPALTLLGLGAGFPALLKLGRPAQVLQEG